MTNVPNFRGQQLYADKFLTNFGISYAQDALTAYVADKLFPRIPVEFESGLFPVWTAAEDFRIDTAGSVRRPGSESTAIDVTKTNGTYVVEGYAKHVYITDRERKSDELGIEQRKTQRLVRHTMALREARCATIATTSATYGANTVNIGSASTKWSVTTGAIGDPFADLATAITAVYNSVGRTPNGMVIPLAIAIALRNHPAFIDRFKAWTGTVETMDLPPMLMGMKVYVAQGMYNTANRNTSGSMTLSPLWGNNVVLFYNEDRDNTDSMGMETLCTFKSFYKSDVSGVFKWYENKRRSTIVEQEEVIQEQIVAPLTGFLLTNVI